MPDETDTKKILTGELGELEETTRTPPYYMDEDYPARPEIQKPLHERSNHRGLESSTLETDVYVWCYALLVVHDTKEEKDDDEVPGTHFHISYVQSTLKLFDQELVMTDHSTS